eukprot:XP_011667890.1 PREDICTED: neurogenic locus notch homolog protein 1 [Strongylocentrotus purpuratus]
MAGNVMTLLSFMIGIYSFLVLCQVQNSNAYPTGVVTSACGDMTPNHGPSSQTSVSPYTISVSPAFYQPGEQMTVTISSNANTPALKGILLQARRTGTDEIIGTWSLAGTTGFQTLACNGANSAVTHTTNGGKPASFQLNWTPPDVNGDDIFVTATFVQTMPVFWVAERTSNIQLTISRNTGSPALKGILLQARRTGTDQIIGTWSLEGTTGFQTLVCNGANSAVTHTSNDDKPAAFQLNWTPPDVNGSDIYVTATFVQTMPVFWVAERTSDIQDACKANGGNLCGANGNCESLVGGGIDCICEEGYTGILCTMGPCDSDPCVNGGTCTYSAGDTTFTCSCPPPLGGPTCQTEINPCDNNSCENGASCNTVVGSITNYTCECPTGFSGKFCELEIDPCANNSCENGATCKPMPNSVNYTCECVIGFSGERCETEINPCDNNSCENGASCNTVVGSITNYTCECPTGFSGEFCEMEINPCDNNSCENGASCNTVVGSITNYTCECPTGFSGKFCELEIDPCANNSCANGATCNPMPNSVNYTCECVIGFSGERCETEINPCDNNSCENGASCNTVVGSITNYTCECPTGFSGEFCEMVQDLCNGNLCENEAGCTSAPGANPPYTCQCQAGFSGFFCGTDNCITNNDWICNNGTCETIQGGGIRCNCFEGFTGTVCDQKSTTTTPCNPDPCKNEGVCAIRGDTWYTCTCPATYVGTNCDIPAPCNPSLCQNGGTCTVTGTESYSCACPPLYTGNNCQTSDPCSSTPCRNGATCTQVFPGSPLFICACTTGFTGDDCSVIVDPCSSSPCNGGTCLITGSGNSAYTCRCPDGSFNPETCPTPDPCTSSPCNGGTCLMTGAGNSAYTCQCQDGSFNPETCPTPADTTLPTITGCPGDITDTALPGDNTLSVTWDEPQASDASGIQSFTPNIQSGFNFPTGRTINVVYTAVDNAGNIQRCGFTVTVNAASGE